MSFTLPELLDVSADLKRDPTRPDVTRDMRNFGHKTPEIIDHERFAESVLARSTTRLEMLEVVRCVVVKPGSIPYPLQLAKQHYEALMYVKEKAEIAVWQQSYPQVYCTSICHPSILGSNIIYNYTSSDSVL